MTKKVKIPYHMKRCSKCDKLKSKVDFSKYARSNDGLKVWCKSCCAKANKKWQRDNREKCREANRRSQQKNYCPEKNREHKLRDRYGISIDEYNRQLQSQSDACGICKGDNEDKRLVVDHCHNSGRVRGLLCHGCNHSLGATKESLDTLRNMISYIESEGMWLNE